MGRRLPKDSVKLKPSSDLRAQAEARMAAQADPAAEARRREQSFLRNTKAAGEDLEWILLNRAWTQLGFERPGDWWEQRVTPVLVNMDLRPSAHLIELAVNTIAVDEKGLPAAQRRTQRELASLVRTTQSKVSRLRPDADASGADLAPMTSTDVPPSSVDGSGLGLHAGPDSDPGDVVRGDVSGQPADDVDRRGAASADGADGRPQSATGSIAPGSVPAGEPAPPVGSPVTPEDSPTPVSGSDSHEQAAPGQESGFSSSTEGTDSPQLSAPSVEVELPAGRDPDVADLRLREAPAIAAAGQSGQDLSPEGGAAGSAASPSSLPDPLGTAELGGGGEEGPRIPLEGPSASQTFVDEVESVRTVLSRWMPSFVAGLGEDAFDALTEFRDFVDEMHDAVVRAVKDQ